MKKLFKILIYFILIAIGFVIVLLVVAKLTENKITNLALNKISKEIKAPVKINDVSFNLLRRFPLATIELNGVSLGSFIDDNKLDSISIDTILSVKSVYVSVKTAELMKGNIEIVKIHLKKGNINYLVDTSGITNIDFLLQGGEEESEPDTTESKPLNLTLTDLSLENIKCNYNDGALKTRAIVTIPNLKVKAKIEGENTQASVRGFVSLSDCSFEETNLCLMNKTELDFDIDYDNDSVYFNNLDISTDGASLSLIGSVVLGDIIKTNINLKATDLTLEELIKYAPDTIIRDFGIKKIAGLLNIEARVEGIYSETEMPKVDAKINLQNGHVVTKDYPELKNITLNSIITNGVLRNNQSTQVNVPVLKFETAKSKFDFNFSVLDIDQIKYSLKTNLDINIGEFKNFIPDTLVKSIDGNMLVQISTKGEIPDSIGNEFIDQVMANSSAKIELKNLNIIQDSLSIKDFSGIFSYKPNNFQIKNLCLSVPEYNVDLSNTSFNADFWGSINNASALRVNLKSYHIETKGVSVSGRAKLKDLDNPDYEFESKIISNLNEAMVMLPDSLAKDLQGNVEINLKSKAKIKMDSIENQVMDIIFNKSSFDLKANNIYAELYDMPSYKIEDFSGHVKMAQDTIEIYGMKGTAAGINFAIDSTEIWNVYPVIILENKTNFLTVQTKININEINNTILAPFLTTDSTEITENNIEADATANKEEVTDSVPASLLPNLAELGVPHFLVRGSLAINKVEYEKNIIDDISLLFRFSDSLYVVDQFKLKTCGGELNTSLKLDARKDWNKPIVDIKNSITTLNVKELLKRNDNFGDTSITYDKINGILTSEMDVKAFYVNGEWPTEKIQVIGHFNLEKGKIYGYEPLVELSKNKLIGGLKELDKLKFNTLKTSIFMFKDKIFIPKTDVQTSSMDFTAFAMNDLKGDYEYHVEVYLGDMFSGKSNELMKKQAKHLKVEGETYERSGGLKLFSSKYGDKKKNGFDSPKKEKAFLDNLNKQKVWLRMFFKPSLVNFSTELDRSIKEKEIIEKYNKEKD